MWITKVLSHREETPTVTSFVLEKPAEFRYQPGQFMKIEIPVENCDNRCNKRNFSLASSPLDDTLLFATRHGVSRFKQTVVNLPPHTDVQFEGPIGKFILNENPAIPGVFLSGGIGITALHSMLKYVVQKKLTKPITLIYSNSTSNDIPFYQDLEEFQKSSDQVKIHHTITGEDPHWAGLKGRINEEMIKRLAPDWEQAEFYTCGPPQMVTAMKELLQKMNIPNEKIKFEVFVGY